DSTERSASTKEEFINSSDLHPRTLGYRISGIRHALDHFGGIQVFVQSAEEVEKLKIALDKHSTLKPKAQRKVEHAFTLKLKGRSVPNDLSQLILDQNSELPGKSDSDLRVFAHRVQPYQGHRLVTLVVSPRNYHAIMQKDKKIYLDHDEAILFEKDN